MRGLALLSPLLFAGCTLVFELSGLTGADGRCAEKGCAPGGDGSVLLDGPRPDGPLSDARTTDGPRRDRGPTLDQKALPKDQKPWPDKIVPKADLPPPKCSAWANWTCQSARGTDGGATLCIATCGVKTLACAADDKCLCNSVNCMTPSIGEGCPQCQSAHAAGCCNP